ncbi:hypothetical protein PR202_gb01092 [Eleusine coracana subsp. coracana]|uniref:Uncharacterized protein n=1 Tax=Eleusine coracana subsp. coracana TaxID=191504 RepID=A0AAV5DU76_ELECO|nr:hypothetical protein PR202_gb01092 [Eleusine coracana subsp. coracana]
MSSSLSIVHSLSLSLALPHRCALPSPRSRGLAPNSPLLGAHRPLLIRAPQRPLLTPRRFAFAVKSSANGAVLANAEGDGGAGTGRKGAGYRNRFLDLARLGAVAESAAEAFFRSEIRRRLTITAALIVLSRVGYFIPLPGFDRRLIPDSYLSFAPLPADDLGDFSSELKLSFFQLGISHQISASIVMQVRIQYMLQATALAYNLILTSFPKHHGQANLPKEISDYLNKMSARVPRIKPGRATVEYLTKIQTSTRFWGTWGLLLSLLATSSLLLDRYLRQINEGFSIGFTSVLIINNGVILNVMKQVGSIIELRRSYQAYNVMPALSKVLRRYGA